MGIDWERAARMAGKIILFICVAITATFLAIAYFSYNVAKGKLFE